jgi:hypothetical protein
MIKERTDKDAREFVFLSADLRAIAEAAEVGFQGIKPLLFRMDSSGTSAAWTSLSGQTADFRADRKKKMGFDLDDRQHPDDPERPKA